MKTGNKRKQTGKLSLFIIFLLLNLTSLIGQNQQRKARVTAPVPFMMQQQKRRRHCLSLRLMKLSSRAAK